MKKKGTFIYSLYRNGLLLEKSFSQNLITTEGLQYLFNGMFNGGNQISIWYFAPFENDYTPTNEDTYAVPGYTECTAYDELIRAQLWLPTDQPYMGTIMSEDWCYSAITMNDTKDIYGAALVGGGSSPTVKGNIDGGGVLFCSSKKSSIVRCRAGDVLTLAYMISPDV